MVLIQRVQMKKFNDCQLKGLILQCLIDGDKTSEQIYSVINLPDYDKHHLHAELYALKRRGYLSRDSKTRIYSLNKKGVVHAQNPYISIIKRRESIATKVSAILENEESFKAAVDEAVSRKSGGTISGGSSGPVSTPSASVNDAKVIQMIRAKDEDITKLQMQLQEMRRSQAQASTGPMSTGPGQQRQQTPEQVREEKLRIKRRRKLCEVYFSRGLLLDSRFFAKYNGVSGVGGVAPYKLKYKPWLSDNSIEILSKSNPEIRRGHAHRQPLPPQAVMQCQFRIVKMDEKGITIAGRGLPDGRARLSF